MPCGRLAPGYTGEDDMERRRLGRLGHDSSVLIYGAAALGEVTQDVADRVGPGGARRRHQPLRRGRAATATRSCGCGPWLPRIRDRIFLATKTGERGRRGRLAADQRLAGTAADRPRRPAAAARRRRPRRARPGDRAGRGAGGGAARAGRGPGRRGRHHRARRQAPATHLEALRRHPFATVLTPLNVVLGRDPRYLRGLPGARRGGPRPGRRPDDHQDGLPAELAGRRADGHRYATWYEPLRPSSARSRPRCPGCSRTTEVTGLATPGDVGLLRLVVAAERDRHRVRTRRPEVLGAAPPYSSPFLDMPI